jgi:hypothetical protein
MAMSAARRTLSRVIREWLAEEVQLVKLRADFLRDRISRSARDQFRRGWRAGYEVGRAHEREGLRYATERYRSDPHPQVEVEGIEVDEGMADLLLALWKLGLDTQYSCQGHVDKFAPYDTFGHSYASQIVFSSIDHAVKFLKKSTELMGYDGLHEGGFVLHSMSPFEDGIGRAAVTFPPAILETLTERWVALELTVPSVEVEEAEETPHA